MPVTSATSFVTFIDKTYLVLGALQADGADFETEAQAMYDGVNAVYNVY